MMKTILNCWLVVAALGAAGCMTYDFEPVEPLAVSQTTQGKNVIARKLKPNIMILLDKSGSMAGMIPGGGSRINELRSAMNTFLTTSGDVARLGLFAFPTNNICGEAGAPAKLRVDMLTNPTDVISELQAKALEVNDSIQKISAAATGDDLVTGGTPTGGALALVGNFATLADKNRDNLVLLLTDGLPNCNVMNPVNCTTGAACKCTLSSCGTSTMAQFCTLGCLDDLGVADAIRDLRKKAIQTIVVGFGADTGAGNAQATLNAMAEAGGRARSCENGCGADGCDPGGILCNTKFYQATNGTELATTLAKISDLLGKEDPCVFKLDAQPTDPSFLTVIIDGQSLNRSDTTWKYESPNVAILGTYCDRIKNATQTAPVNVVIRIVEKL